MNAEADQDLVDISVHENEIMKPFKKVFLAL